MNNHIHLIAEADDRLQLSRGMQGLKIRMAKRLNKVWSRPGAVFGERYHATEIATPTQTRNALAYVLGNARKHAAQGGQAMPRRWVDPFSSSRQFDGWRQRVRQEEGVVEPAQSWLLREGWRKRGPLEVDAVPRAGPGS